MRERGCWGYIARDGLIIGLNLLYGEQQYGNILITLGGLSLGGNFGRST
jgi:hypothetical protein